MFGVVKRRLAFVKTVFSMLMLACPVQVAFSGPAQDVIPITMMRDGVYVNGDL